MGRNMDEEKKTPAEELPAMNVSFKEARSRGLYTASALRQKHLKPISPPVGVIRNGRRRVKLYDIQKTEKMGEKDVNARRLSRCQICGGVTGSENGICHKCVQAQKNRTEYQLYEAEKTRAAEMDLSKMVFLDLEMTGDSRADEILSVSMTDGNGKVLLDTLIHPKVATRWPFTVRIHHITPKMVKHSPTIDEVEGRIFEILRDAEEILGYSISNDWKYLKVLPSVAPLAEELYEKVRCCQMFYDHFVKHDMPELENGKRSLVNAMKLLGLDWEGKQHSSLGDTLACMHVWRRLFLERDLIRVPEPEAEETETEALAVTEEAGV